MKYLLPFLLLVLAPLGVFAEPATIHVDKAGKLASLLESHKEGTEFIITGKINDPDLRAIASTLTKIESLNLRGVSFEKFVGEGDDEYFDANTFSTGISRVKTLKHLILPATTKKMALSSLYGCTGLRTLTVYATVPPEIDYNLLATDAIYAQCKLLVPAESVEAYKEKKTAGWGFASIEAIPSTPTGYPADHYTLSEDKTTLLSWIGDETEIDFTKDPILGKVKIISQKAFFENKKLVAVILPQQIDSIGDRAFMSCSSLKEIILPASLSAIGKVAFANCYALRSFTVADGSASFKAIEGVLYSADGKTLVSYPNAKGNTYTTPTEVRHIGLGAFSGCKDIEQINLNDGIEDIGFGAFAFCRALTQISLPGSVRKIDDFAFNACSSLTTISLPEGLDQINAGLFFYCNKLKDINLPKTIQSIGARAFTGCTSLESFVAPEELRSIKMNAFDKCTLLKEIKLNTKIEELQNFAFTGCTGLKEIESLAIKVPACGEDTFDGVEISKIELSVPQRMIEEYRKDKIWKQFVLKAITAIDFVSPTLESPIVYPTITTGTVSVRNTTSQMRYDVWTVSGSSVMRGTLASPIIDLSALPSGTYLIVVTDTKQCTVSKTLIIKQ